MLTLSDGRTGNMKKTAVYLVLIGVVLAAILGLLFWHRGQTNSMTLPQMTPRPGAVSSDGGKKRVVTVEKEVTAEVIQDGLREMGLLTTEEYYFTEVVSYSSVKKLWRIELGITESSYLISYDGVVTAGIDLRDVQVEKDDQAKRVRITIPAAAIQQIDIDPDSFQLYTEKEGLGNPVSVADFNDSLVELEETAREKALNRGILERASTSAEALVLQFAESLLDTEVYTFEIVQG